MKKEETGVYIALLVNEKTNNLMQEFCSQLNINLEKSNPIFIDGPLANRLHSSLILSNCGNYKSVNIQHHINNSSPLSAKAISWHLMRSQISGKQVLTLKLYSERLLELHEVVKEEHGLKHNFSDYIPHLSLHYDFKGELPNKLPNFNIELDDFYIKRLSNKKIEDKNDSQLSLKKQQNNIFLIRKNTNSENIIKPLKFKR